MSKIHSADIRAELRPAAQLLRFTAPAPGRSGFERYDRQCIRKYAGKWTSRDTIAEEKAIIREDGSVLRLLVVRSIDGSMEDATGLLWLHDGGYAFGVPEQDSLVVDEFCGDGSCVAVMPDYIKSLEAPYPAALEDCYKTLLWMRDNAEELGINREQLFVGGGGAGGGLTAALCLRARDMGDVHIAFQMPLYPMLDDRMENESSRENNAPVWDSRRNRAAWDLYLRDMEGSDIPVYAAPGREEDFSGMPPACSFVGDLEPLKDETVLYFARMKKAGVPVALRVYHGCYHAFDVTAVNSEVAHNARRYIMESFRYAQQHYYAHNKAGEGALFEQAGKIESMPQVVRRGDASAEPVQPEKQAETEEQTQASENQEAQE